MPNCYSLLSHQDKNVAPIESLLCLSADCFPSELSPVKRKKAGIGGAERTASALKELEKAEGAARGQQTTTAKQVKKAVDLLEDELEQPVEEDEMDDYTENWKALEDDADDDQIDAVGGDEDTYNS